MDTYKIMKIEDIIKATPYLGRGIVTGTSSDGKYAVIGYFISGRSENSRNRIFVENGSEVIIHPSATWRGALIYPRPHSVDI